MKLSRANALLYKTRNFVNSSILRTLYFAIFESHHNYRCLVWSQNCNTVNRLVILQKKLLELLTFSHVTLTLVLYSKEVLFWNSQIKLLKKTLFFVSKCINNLLPSLFNDWFLFSSDQHNHETSWSSLGNLHKLSYKTDLYGKNYIIVSAINVWNNSQELFKISLRHLSPNKIKKILSDAFFAKYWNELSTFRYFKLMLADFQILLALYSFFGFLPVVFIYVVDNYLLTQLLT